MGESMIRKKKSNPEVVFDLTGPQGNAFFLLGQVKSIGEYRGFCATQIKNICDEMTSCDYENLVSVFDNYFGDYIILER
jgi:hypothetical protein